MYIAISKMAQLKKGLIAEDQKKSDWKKLKQNLTYTVLKEANMFSGS